MATNYNNMSFRKSFIQQRLVLQTRRWNMIEHTAFHQSLFALPVLNSISYKTTFNRFSRYDPMRKEAYSKYFS
jgi:hypothetical protein